ncbi:putative porin [Cupriavidus sp. WS]|uniref:putative porin n=1 Tax=Cupriavidus sp. WS TaxID=1312922 RepID=UPI000381B537|nr:putative porin [Cupriavidus sp. WS]
MSQCKAPRLRRPALRPLAALTLAACCQQALAQGAPPSGDVTQNLIRILVMRGTLTKEEGETLLAQARAAAQPEAAATVAGVAAGAVAGAAAQPGDVRVPYVSPRVRQQIRDEVKQDVIARAREEHWATPNTFPDWVSRITLSGDVRVRYQANLYGSGNAPAVDYAAVNASGPVDFANANGVLPPLLNTDQNRADLLRLRARLGVSAAISDDLTAGIRLGTGSSNGPVSTTQTLGGGFAKKSIWLDQAFLDYRFSDAFRVTAGRFGNPFYGLDNADLVFSNDLNFDGIAGSWLKPVGNRGVTAFVTAGAFPVNYSDDNFPSREPGKADSHNQWLFALQAGAEWKNGGDRFKGALAYYHFTDMRGRFSSPCLTSATFCDTDATRPAFMQKGNTVFGLRNNVPVNVDDTSNPQFFGLTQAFRPLNLTAQWDTHVFGHLPFSLQASYVRNLAYNKDRAFTDPRSYPANHYEGVDSSTPLGEYKQKWRSGPNGYVLRAIFGNQAVSARGQWNFLLGYKYLQPDAVPDGYTDPDFRLGGTNAKGYFLGAAYGIDKNAWLQARWLSGREVYGDPLAINVLMLELNAKF